VERVKFQLVRDLLQRDLDRHLIRELFRLIDWNLPLLRQLRKARTLAAATELVKANNGKGATER
jgi:hypothetical protein